MQPLSFEQARRVVLEQVRGAAPEPAIEHVPLEQAFGRILAADICADRDYPPLARSIRDGFAVRAADLPGELEVIGELRAGEPCTLHVGAGQAVEIMTGAPVPAGADAVVMVEHVERNGRFIRTNRAVDPGSFINPQGAEARCGAVVVSKGAPLSFARIAMLAAVGVSAAPVYARPTVSILATGDEVVPVEQTPQPFQVRNSNAYALAVQVRRAGGEPRMLPVARDAYAHTRALIEQGLQADLLLLSGGVSAGKYDIVEQVLSDLGAEFYFCRVRIQPGQPLVFGRLQEKFFFGLPGNPASSMLTFEVFARAAVELLGGRCEPELPVVWARLGCEFRHKRGLTRILPACLSSQTGEVTPLAWAGSSDIVALARANAFLLADEEREFWAAGDYIPVLLP